MKKLLPIAILVVIMIVGGIYYFAKKSSAEPTSTEIASSTPLMDEKTALAQLQADMQNITPHFILDNKEASAPSVVQEETKIRNDVVALYAARYAADLPADHAQSALVEAQNNVYIGAIGKRYILVTEASKFAIDETLDVQTGQAKPFYNDGNTKREYLTPERDIALYIEPKALYTYSLDQAGPTIVAGSQLSGTETYHSGYIDGATTVLINPVETHTKNSITISIFDSSKSVPNPDVSGATMYAKVGQKTLSF